MMAHRIILMRENLKNRLVALKTPGPWVSGWAGGRRRGCCLLERGARGGHQQRPDCCCGAACAARAATAPLPPAAMRHLCGSPARARPTRAQNHITDQIGMFAFSGMTPEQVDKVRARVWGGGGATRDSQGTKPKEA